MGQKITVELPRERECKGSVRFLLKNASPVESVYVSREWAELATAKAVRVTVEIVP